MSSIEISLLIPACLLVAAALGFFLNGVLPGHHFNTESRDSLKVVIGGDQRLSLSPPTVARRA